LLYVGRDFRGRNQGRGRRGQRQEDPRYYSEDRGPVHWTPKRY